MQPVKMDGVYFVKEFEELHINPVAIRPEYLFREDLHLGSVKWGDTSKGFQNRIDEVKVDSTTSEIHLHTEDGDDLTLVKLTNALYNQHVREYVYDKPTFSSDEELQNYYLNNNFNP